MQLGTSDVIAFFALVVSIASALIAYTSVRSANRAAQAELLAPFLTQYSTTEMRDALICLGQWRDANPSLLERITRLEQFEPAYIQGCVSDAKQSIEDDKLNSARRYVHHYFKIAYKMWDKKLLHDRYIDCIINVEGRALLYDVVKPLSLAVHLVILCNCNPEEFIKARNQFDWFDKLKRFTPLSSET